MRTQTRRFGLRPLDPGLVVALCSSVVLACGGGGSSGGDGPAATPSPSGPTPIPSPTPEPTLDDLALRRIAEGLSSPLFLTTPPDEPDRLFVVEQTGRIVILNGTSGTRTFLDLSDRVRFGGELGLLGLAFHPAFADNGLFYVNYTDDDLVSVTSEFRVDPNDAERGDPDSERRILEVPLESVSRHGGMLAFGPDGALYLSLGDSAQSGDPNGNAQNPTDFRGKILRFDPLTFPEPLADNPGFENPHVWHLGLCNPWRFSFDRETGDFYAGDVGEAEEEEVDFASAGVGGLNYGWNLVEGAVCFRPPDEPRPECPLERFVAPVFSYGHDAGCSVTGGYVYRGDNVPPLRGLYLFSDYCNARVTALRVEDGVAREVTDLTPFLDPDGRLNAVSSFGEDGHGELYVIDGYGSVYRIESRR